MYATTTTTTPTTTPSSTTPQQLLSVWGTRAVLRQGECDFRVVCAGCGGGGMTHHKTSEAAEAHAIRDREKVCTVCRPELGEWVKATRNRWVRYCGPCDRIVHQRQRECKYCGADTDLWPGAKVLGVA